MQVFAEFLARASRDLETKRDLGKDIGTLDLLSVAADVLAPVTVAKALEFFNAGRTARISGVAGGPVEASGGTLKAGLTAVTVYLVVQHPPAERLLRKSGPNAWNAVVACQVHRVNFYFASVATLTTKEEGVAVVAGTWLGGNRSVLPMQSSGVGNRVNMFSLLQAAEFPFFHAGHDAWRLRRVQPVARPHRSEVRPANVPRDVAASLL